MDVNIKLPVPHLKQVGPINSDASRKVLNCGRRAGKTEYLASFESVPRFLGYRIKCDVLPDGNVKVRHVPLKHKARILYGAPSDDQTMVYWDTINKHLHDLIRGGFIYRNKTKRYLEWLSGGDGRIRAKTAYDADSWRGDWGNLLLFDEWAITNPDAWEVVGMPMLLDKGGGAIFSSTPNRKNHHYAYFNRGNDPLQLGWESFVFSSLENPHLDKATLEELTWDMDSDTYRQEILGEFLENEGAVFRNIGANLHAKHTRPNDHAGHFLIAGVDWGKHQDYTVISVGCNDCKQEVYLDRFNQIDYAFQSKRLGAIIKDWNVVDILAEQNAMGEPALEMLQHQGLPARGFVTTATSKPVLIENLKLSLERVEFQFLPDPIAGAELEAYEVKISERTGRPFYSAPAGVHDDTVIARALMLQAINSYMPAFL